MLLALGMQRGPYQPQKQGPADIPAVELMLADGYWPGASTMVADPSGSAENAHGNAFHFSGTAKGQTGIIATFQENSTQLDRIAAGFGWSLANESVELMYRLRVDLDLDDHKSAS